MLRGSNQVMSEACQDLSSSRYKNAKKDACYDRDAPLFFLILPLKLGAKDLFRKPFWSEI